ncbi:phosphoribosylglycinamide formyltransferase [Candidatus Pelagibacter sp.]|nr:phosphoribosylglycinamide formyltransferase [Candidatus Pelagibacter sp.]
MEKLSGKKNTAVLISGRGSNLRSLVKYSKKKKSLIRIVLVVSNNFNAKGLDYADRSRINNVYIKDSNRKSFEDRLLKLLKKNNVDLICLAGFMKILSGSFIRKFNKTILNIHPSLLPKYKGLNTHNKAIQNKDKYSGATVHIVNEKLDSGKIIIQKKVKILKTDTINSLQKKVLKIEHKIYPKAIIRFLTSD